MKNGVKPLKKDHRDYSYHRTFGNVATSFIECNFDAGFPVTNQEIANPLFNIPALPFGCTGYTSTGLCQDADKKQYNPRYTYDETLAMEGIFEGNREWEKVGCDIRDSLKSTIVYGVQAPGEMTGDAALTHRRGAYFALERIGSYDWFDTLRVTFENNKRSISIATPWFPSFAIAPDGIVTAPLSYTDLSEATWHNHRAPGWKMINGLPYIIDYSHQGEDIGDNGALYFGREIINQLMDIPGSGAFTLAPFDGTMIYTVKLTILQTIVSYLRMILAL